MSGTIEIREVPQDMYPKVSGACTTWFGETPTARS